METIPRYLTEVLAEASDYYEQNEDVSRGAASHEIAHQNDSLIRDDEGERSTLDVLGDIKDIHSLCANRFETYRAGQVDDYTNSILEAIALRSLEELINVHLDESQSFDNAAVPSNREVEYINPDNPNVASNIQVHVSAKEAIDIDDALSSYMGEVSGPVRDTVADFNRLWKGGINGLNDTTVMLTNAEDVSILVSALEEYEPDEADFTMRVRNDVLEAIAAPQSHINPNDVDPSIVNRQEVSAD